MTSAATGTPTRPRPSVRYPSVRSPSGGCPPERACADRPTDATSSRSAHRRPRSRGAVAPRTGTSLPPARCERRTRHPPSSGCRPRSTTAAGSARHGHGLPGAAPGGTGVADRRSGDAHRPTSEASSRSGCRPRRSRDADRRRTETVLPTAVCAARTRRRRSPEPPPRSTSAATSARRARGRPDAALSRTARWPTPTAARPT